MMFSLFYASVTFSCLGWFLILTHFICGPDLCDFFLLGSPKINIYYHWCLTFILICEVILITADNHCEVLGCITCIFPLNSHNKLMNYLLPLFYWWNSERLGTSQNWHLNLGASHSRIHVLNTMLWERLKTQERLTSWFSKSSFNIRNTRNKSQKILQLGQPKSVIKSMFRMIPVTLGGSKSLLLLWNYSKLHHVWISFIK